MQLHFTVNKIQQIVVQSSVSGPGSSTHSVPHVLTDMLQIIAVQQKPSNQALTKIRCAGIKSKICRAVCLEEHG